MAVPDSLAESRRGRFLAVVLDLEPDPDQAPEWAEETPDSVDGVPAQLSDAILEEIDVATVRQQENGAATRP